MSYHENLPTHIHTPTHTNPHTPHNHLAFHTPHPIPLLNPMLRTNPRARVLKTLSTLLFDRGYDLVACVDGAALATCKKGKTLGPEDVDDRLSRFALFSTPQVACAMIARVPANPDRASFVRHIPEGTKLCVYLTNDATNLGKSPILAIIQDARKRGAARVIIPLAQSYTSHATKEIANAKAEHGMDIEIFAYTELNVPLAQHALSPKYRVLSDAELEAHLRKYDLHDKFQLPKLEECDPQARYYGLTTGLVVEVHRPSLYYRVVIPASG